MGKLTNETRYKLRTLRLEAEVAGDYDQAALCTRALAGDQAALAACEAAMAEAAL